MSWGCPQNTRSYFVQQILCCGFTSAKTDILTRFIKFFESLRTSASVEVQMMSRMISRDVRSTLGKNLRMISDLSGLNPWLTSLPKMQEALIANETVPVPTGDEWRIPYLCKLLSQRSDAYNEARDEDAELLSSYIKSLVIN